MTAPATVLFQTVAGESATRAASEPSLVGSGLRRDPGLSPHFFSPLRGKPAGKLDSQNVISGCGMSEDEVEFLAGDFCQIEGLFDFILEIIVSNRQLQPQLFDLRRVVFDDKFWFVEFAFFIHGCHSFLCF
jgi:hypothetical protein